ncbi:alpha/beta hydrolase family protein [Cellulomonas sp. S1-8]|uniref:alpha/beta hydrolase family protein n=1 Tax=Cellulomonas sp. S1-8 TaxID=2904790 RepID=UPI0022449CD9|nr:alpha/beta hydrolase [Cellulomonas sp. S1-8]UZN03040.1 alpha/beta hydrolase [Cellulomonas sp. S1-8]
MSRRNHVDPVPPTRPTSSRRRRALLLATVLLTWAATLSPASPALAAGYERGPAPTTATLDAARGPFAVSQERVYSWRASGFGGGDIYYPTATDQGTFGVVAIAPGYTAGRSTMAWLASRIASHGFVVINIDTTTRSDQPTSRGRQLLAALDHVTGASAVRDRADASRQAVVGHSMGGGGALVAATSRPTLQAAVPLTPWNLTKSWSSLQVPTLVVGAERDSVASVRTHAEPFYESMPAALPKGYLELNNASHFAPVTTNSTIGRYTVAWLKRYVDDDLRYHPFLCPAPAPSSAIEEFRATC